MCGCALENMACPRAGADIKTANVKKKWRERIRWKAINAYRQKDLALFEIGGVRIPTASAILRFLFLDEYGIIDSRVVQITQRANVTQLDLRDDGYIKRHKRRTKNNTIITTIHF